MIRFGIKPFNEQKIIANLIKRELKVEFEIVVSDPIPQGNFLNLKDDKINLAVDYLGTLYNAVFNYEEIIPWNKNLMIEKVKKGLKEFDIDIISFLGFSNDFVFISKEYICDNFEELCKKSQNLKLGCPPPFIERKDGIPLLSKFYDLNFKEIVPLNVQQIYEALLDDKVQVIIGFKTDSKIEKYNLYLILENKNILPPYDAILIGKNLEENVKKKLSNFKLDENEIRHLNYLFEKGEINLEI